MKTLILNSDYSPFDIVGYRKALALLYCSDTVYGLDYYARTITDSAGREYAVPAVIVLKKYVSVGNKAAPYNKLNVYARDNFHCQYCMKKCTGSELTIDHIIPRSKWKEVGSPTRFDNVVASCKKCNSIKADKSLEQCGFYLRKKPKGMTRTQAFNNKLRCLSIPPEWRPYVK